jgi:hypothetical protein
MEVLKREREKEEKSPLGFMLLSVQGSAKENSWRLVSSVVGDANVHARQKPQRVLYDAILKWPSVVEKRSIL